jgi:demethoxyubiquinone hydroxylase (CLK1/Coq7/Cat5 family)
MDKHSARHSLIEILQNAYSGELAAAYAYRGHWKSLTRQPEISKVQQIENEEWIHRRNVGRMLAELGARPSRIKEARLWIIGRSIGLICHLIGWFLPMYFAGRLESRNTEEYLNAAFYARELGLMNFIDELLVMSAVEKEHEVYFWTVIQGHRLLPITSRLFKWGRPGVLPVCAAVGARIEGQEQPDPSDL